ncbi:hypothetical protein O1611_g6977 [Lasiodiplodia mahajangana]|uniref:Uncharacterized protein n=1 Tax=Lasiodiplodia mahajangana TaxID=1108764 RepID=A0ACC2JH06_9PEZI|nr:hypothetical protein O1611_g6977 [Lasiodiplodia mahajangana]
MRSVGGQCSGITSESEPRQTTEWEWVAKNHYRPQIRAVMPSALFPERSWRHLADSGNPVPAARKRIDATTVKPPNRWTLSTQTERIPPQALTIGDQCMRNGFLFSNRTITNREEKLGTESGRQ